ncbi:MAG: hypothetical protein V2A70_04070 [Candidatus Omnitrophota bacterium]
MFNRIFKKITIFFLLFVFLLTGAMVPVSAQVSLFKPKEMVALSPIFHPPIFKGVKVYADNPFRMDFILDKGDSTDSQSQWQSESSRLVKYFLASLTIPEKDLWVNLSPYEKNRIVPEAFGQTEMGRDLLAQDYILKQITASLMYPEADVGKKFWAKVYATAQEKYGTTDIPVDTLNKVWIVPERAVVYESRDSVYIAESRLKVMLEEDYLALEKNAIAADQVRPSTNKLGSDIVREVVIPILEKEVNEGQNFAALRQIYDALILAVWFKDKVKQGLLGKAYVDQNKIVGVDIQDKAAKDKIWAQYVEAFKKGAYNFIKEEPDPFTDEMMTRRYFSGGAWLSTVRDKIERKDASQARLPDVSSEALIVQVNLDAAMADPASASEGIVDGQALEKGFNSFYYLYRDSLYPYSLKSQEWKLKELFTFFFKKGFVLESPQHWGGKWDDSKGTNSDVFVAHHVEKPEEKLAIKIDLYWREYSPLMQDMSFKVRTIDGAKLITRYSAGMALDFSLRRDRIMAFQKEHADPFVELLATGVFVMSEQAFAYQILRHVRFRYLEKFLPDVKEPSEVIDKIVLFENFLLHYEHALRSGLGLVDFGNDGSNLVFDEARNRLLLLDIESIVLVNSADIPKTLESFGFTRNSFFNYMQVIILEEFKRYMQAMFVYKANFDGISKGVEKIASEMGDVNITNYDEFFQFYVDLRRKISEWRESIAKNIVVPGSEASEGAVQNGQENVAVDQWSRISVGVDHEGTYHFSKGAKRIGTVRRIPGFNRGVEVEQIADILRGQGLFVEAKGAYVLFKDREPVRNGFPPQIKAFENIIFESQMKQEFLRFGIQYEYDEASAWGHGADNGIGFKVLPEQAPWLMDAMRPVNKSYPIMTSYETMPEVTSVFDLEKLPVLAHDEFGTSRGIALGMIRREDGVVHPAAIKKGNITLAELKALQVLGNHLGILPEFYGVIKNAHGGISGYAFSIIAFGGGRFPSNDHPDIVEIYRRIKVELGGRLFLGSEGVSRTGRVIGYDAGDYKAVMGVFDDYILRLKGVVSNVDEAKESDRAMAPGGIDLTPQRMDVQTNPGGHEIQFNIDPTQLKRLQQAPGLMPVVINISPLRSLRSFMGVKN